MTIDAQTSEVRTQLLDLGNHCLDAMLNCGRHACASVSTLEIAQIGAALFDTACVLAEEATCPPLCVTVPF